VYVDAALPLTGKDEQVGAKQRARERSLEAHTDHGGTIADRVLTQVEAAPSLCAHDARANVQLRI
jgi:hypothetical protein